MNEEQHSKGKKKIELLKSEAAFSISVFDFPDFFTFFFFGQEKRKILLVALGSQNAVVSQVLFCSKPHCFVSWSAILILFF